ncbi:MAG: NAD(+)/NADH kinase [Chloroflexi bacterium]|nr:NAD(+)/NADH kinase [Chloroflexota bacterium]
MSEKRHLIGFMQSRKVSGASEMIRSLIDTLDLHDRSWVAHVDDEDIAPEILRATAFIVTAGGDGTIIRVNRMASPYSVPIVGINMGRVGFMAELSVENAAERLPQYLEGKVRTEERLMLQAEVTAQSNGQTRIVDHALNEAIVRGTLPRLLDVEVTIDGVKLATYRADGVIVSTPTGSTGYALSAGGPVLQPESRVLLVQPLAAHISLQTGLVVPDSCTVELAVVGAREALISVDNLTNAALHPNDKVVIRKSPHIASFLRADPPSAFYSTLTQRLGVSHRTTHDEH